MTDQSLYVFLLLSLSLPAVFCKHDYFEYYYSKYHKGVSTTEAVGELKHSSSVGSTAGVTSASTSLDISSTRNTFSSTRGSTAEVTPASTSLGISSTGNTFSSTREDSSEEEVSSSEDDNKQSIHHNKNTTILHGDPYNNVAKNMFIARIGIIVGSVVFFIVCLGCIICCCPSCCRGSQRRGFVMRANADERGTGVAPEPLIAQTPHQPAFAQHIPPQYMQEPMQYVPPEYHPQVMQPQPQYQPQQLVQPQPPYSPMHPGYQYSPAIQFSNPPEAPPPYEATAPPCKY